MLITALILIILVSIIFIIVIVSDKNNNLIYAVIGLAILLLLVTNLIGHYDPKNVTESQTQKDILNGKDRSVINIIEGEK